MRETSAVCNPARRDRSVAFARLNHAWWPLACIVLLLVLQTTLVFTRAINWDESLHFAELYDIANGRPAPIFQTLYLRPYEWVVGFYGTVIDQIVISRIGQFIWEIITLVAIYLTARRFVDKTSALTAALAYLASGYILLNGFSLRADPVVTATLMTSLAVLITGQLTWGRAGIAGLLGGIAPMLSIKAVLYAPVFAGVAVLLIALAPHRKSAIHKLAVCGLTALATFAVTYWMHGSFIEVPSNSQSNVLGFADSAAKRMFFIGRPNNLGAFVGFLLANVGTTLLILFTPWAIAYRDVSQAEKICLAGFSLPMLLPFFYENTAPYFYVFMFAPVAVACSVTIVWVRERVPIGLISILITALALPLFATENREVIDRQRRLSAEIIRTFPTTVAYFDHADVAPHLLKRNPFQSPWGYRAYLEKGEPIYAQAMEREPVPMMVANWWTFRNLFAGDDSLFLREDASALRENYLPFNGPIRLAGKQLPANRTIEAKMLVPGPYTIHDAAIFIDGKPYSEGTVVTLARQTYRMRTAQDGTEARLLWGRNLSPIDRLDFDSTWVPF